MSDAKSAGKPIAKNAVAETFPSFPWFFMFKVFVILIAVFVAFVFVVQNQANADDNPDRDQHGAHFLAFHATSGQKATYAVKYRAQFSGFLSPTIHRGLSDTSGSAIVESAFQRPTPA